MLNPAEKALYNLLFEVHAGISSHHAVPYAPGKLLIADPQNIEYDTVVQELDLDRPVWCNTRRRV